VPSDLLPVQSLWVGATLSQIEELSLSSFLMQGHRVVLYVDRSVDRVPQGVEVRPISDIYSGPIFTYGRKAKAGQGSVAAFADYFRYLLLYRKGGWWIDTDVIALRPFEFDTPYCFGYERDGVITNTIIKAPRGDRLMKQLARGARYPILGFPWEDWKRRMRNGVRRLDTVKHPGNVKWGTGGPRALTGGVKYHNLEEYAQSPNIFYPIPWRETEQIFFGSADSVAARCKNSFSIHLWNEVLRRKGIEKNQEFPAGSFFARLREELR